MNAAQILAVSTILSVSAAIAPARAQSPPTPTPTPTPTAPAQAATPAPKERIAEVKKSFMLSQTTLRSYEWIETTTTTLKDEEKARTTSRCYYGAEGPLQKVAVTAPAPDKAGRGLRGKIAENKKEELGEYMNEAAALVHKYVPPNPEKLQKCADAGKASIEILEPASGLR